MKAEQALKQAKELAEWLKYECYCAEEMYCYLSPYELATRIVTRQAIAEQDAEDLLEAQATLKRETAMGEAMASLVSETERLKGIDNE